ncbi:MAG TPA: MFS transporter [Elusimicrobiales bacterium]|nr:MFS transporter [Elusimicrobiales bacterium]
MKDGKVRRSVRASVKDGVAWAGMTGFVEPYLIPFALALGASNPAIGFLRAAPPLAASLAQLLNEKMILALGSCRRAVRLDVLAQALSLFAAAAAGLLPARWAVPCLALAMVAYTVSGNLAGPPWAALMGEYIPASRRGAFFGFRNQVVGVSFFAASLAAAKFLKFYPGVAAFSALFAAAGVLRLLSFRFIGGMYERPSGCHMPRPASAAPAAPRDPAGRSAPGTDRGQCRPDPSLTPFLLSIFAAMFSVFLAAPYFSVYLLRDLEYGYVPYMMVMTSGQIVTYLVMRRWGWLADSFGSVRVLRFAFLSIPLVPLLWALAPSFHWLLAAELFSGIVWAAYGMGTNNFIYELGGISLRARYNALFGFTACLGQFAGALAGGYLYGSLPGEAFVTLLYISAGLRLAAAVPFFRGVRERDVPGGHKPGFLLAAIGFRSVDVYPVPPGK